MGASPWAVVEAQATTVTAPPTQAAEPRGFRAWVLRHDDSRAFTYTYIALAVVLSIAVSLFWLVALLAVHVVLDWMRESADEPRKGRVLLEVLWCLKLDVALVLFAFALSLYMEAGLGVLGLSAGSRAASAAATGARAGAKVAAWQRVLRGALLSLDDAAQVGRAVLAGKRPKPAALPPAEEPDARSLRFGSWSGRWGKGDWAAVAIGALCGVLVLAAPAALGQSLDAVAATLAAELRPLP